MENADVRTKTRRRQFEAVVSALADEGIHAEIEVGRIPQNETQIIGLTSGIANFNWATSGSQLLPGAFCDNLTSFGGVLQEKATQTPLSAFLRHGAAGACGTVTEPYALAHKFPHATMHLHYARGCCLAEAYYRSVKSPYQLLLVGDPLCSPWALSPSIRVAVSSDSGRSDSVGGKIVFRPTSTARNLRFILYADGRRVADCKPGEKLRMDTTRMPDGYHEFRVVAQSVDSVSMGGRKILPLMVNNHGQIVTGTLQPQRGEDVLISVNSNGGDGVQAWCRRRLVGMLNKPQGTISVPQAILGRGPAKIQLVAVSATTKSAISFGRPITIESAVSFKSEIRESNSQLR
jgi:hypothetical protein